MSETPIFWQAEPSRIHTPDGGDTFHITDESDGSPRVRAMARATLIAQLVGAIEALAGPEGSADLTLISAEIARRRRTKR